MFLRLRCTVLSCSTFQVLFENLDANPTVLEKKEFRALAGSRCRAIARESKDKGIQQRAEDVCATLSSFQSLLGSQASTLNQIALLAFQVRACTLSLCKEAPAASFTATLRTHPCNICQHRWVCICC